MRVVHWRKPIFAHSPAKPTFFAPLGGIDRHFLIRVFPRPAIVPTHYLHDAALP